MRREAMNLRAQVMEEAPHEAPDRILRNRVEKVQVLLREARMRVELLEQDRAAVVDEVAELESSLKLLESAVEGQEPSVPVRPETAKAIAVVVAFGGLVLSYLGVQYWFTLFVIALVVLIVGLVVGAAVGLVVLLVKAIAKLF
jgi:hypothetical protein